MDDLISKLSEIRSQYNLFNESEEPYYRALSEVIKMLSEQADGDTISRQAAIDALYTEIIKRRLMDDVNDGMLDEFDTESILKKLPSAQTNLQQTCNQLATDCISRQAALDALEWEWAGKAAIDAIKALPSAQPEPQWVQCSKRMPEEHEWIGTKKFGTTISDEVYVTFENEKGERFCKHMNFQNGELGSYDKDFMEVWHKGSKPIAWMPLPEPYKEGTDDR